MRPQYSCHADTCHSVNVNRWWSWSRHSTCAWICRTSLRSGLPMLPSLHDDPNRWFECASEMWTLARARIDCDNLYF